MSPLLAARLPRTCAGGEVLKGNSHYPPKSPTLSPSKCGKPQTIIT